MRSVMNHQFSNVPSAEIPRSVFNRSYTNKTTFNVDYIVPFFVDEVLPGDTFKVKTTIFARLATPLKPIMDNMFLETFFFAVPKRLVWDHWVNFMGEMEGIEPSQETEYTIPQILLDAGEVTEMSLADYFGLPIIADNDLHVNALPFRCYNLIYNEWFRDQNLIERAYLAKGEVTDVLTNFPLLKRCKRPDYFTSCLPEPQRGASVDLPLGTEATVRGNGYALGLAYNSTMRGLVANRASGNEAAIAEDAYGTAIGTACQYDSDTGALESVGVVNSTDATKTGLIADLTNATAATINSLRQAFQLQKLYERDARGGTRYIEIIRSHFQVISPDFRLQRPELLGMSSQRISINPVQQTAMTTSGGTTGVGNLGAFGVVVDYKGGFTKSFTEHCYVLGLMNVRADLTYQQGLDKLWSRSVRQEFYWPELSHIGEQAVLNKEIFCIGEEEGPEEDWQDNQVFGYQERFAEYRYKRSMITGQMRSGSVTPLHIWHLSEWFSNLPVLNDEFIISNTPIERCVASVTPHFIADIGVDMMCARPMPVYSVPGLLDHF